MLSLLTKFSRPSLIREGLLRTKRRQSFTEVAGAPRRAWVEQGGGCLGDQVHDRPPQPAEGSVTAGCSSVVEGVADDASDAEVGRRLSIPPATGRPGRWSRSD